jgi:LmbE family N-acetylglucosaminyl deacetylase
MARACNILGVAERTVLFAGREMRLDQMPMLDLVAALDHVLARTRYDEVYFPYAAVNHDHEITYKAALAALRVGRQPPPRLCAAYEYALIGWQPDGVPGGKLYVDIDGSPLDSKVRAAAAYESQAKPYPHPCNSRSIRTLAAMRGMEVGLAAAEMFYVLRMVEATHG